MKTGYHLAAAAAAMAAAASLMLAAGLPPGFSQEPGSIEAEPDSLQADTLGIALFSANDPADELLVREFVPPTPTSAVFAKHMAPQPALSTGAVTMSVPVYTIDFKGTSIPLSLDYQSNGIKVYDNPFPCGYGWSLSPGLRVTRTVIGRPDETYKSVSEYSGSSSYEKQRLCVLSENSPANKTDLLDPGTDVFRVHLPGASAVMALVRGTGDSFAFAGPDSTISMQSSDRYLSSLTVTDGAGIKYVFDASEYANGITCTGWMLKEMQLPFGQKITFEWAEHSNPNHRMGQSSASFTDDYHDVEQTGFQAPELELSNVTEREIDSHAKYKSLKSITWPGGNAVVDYGTTAQGTDRLITAIRILDHTGALVKKADLSYHANRKHFVDRKSLCLLKTVAIGGQGAYSFEYDPQDFQYEFAQDLWGYYNGKTGNSSLLPKMKISACSRINHQGVTDDEYLTVDGGNRSANEQAMQACMLNKVTYPTGGTTEFEYEAHRFVNPCALSIGYGIVDQCDIDFESTHSPCIGGGLRVKRTVTAAGDGSPAITREYAYGADGDGVAICSIVPSLHSFVTRSVYHTDQDMKYRSTIVSTSSNSAFLDMGEPAMWYADVTETTSAGKTEYTFELCKENEYAPYHLIVPQCEHDIMPATRRPKKLYPSVSPGPAMTSTVSYAKNGSSYTATTSVELLYECGLYAPAGTQLDVRRKMQCAIGSYQPDYPPCNNMDGGYFVGPGIRWNGDSIYDSASYWMLFCSAPQVKSRVTTVYGDDGRAASYTETYKYLSGSGLPTEASVSDGCETRTTRISYAMNVAQLSLIDQSQQPVLSQMRSKHHLTAPVLVEKTAGGATSVSQIFYAAAGTSFAPSKVVAKRDGQTMAMGQWTTDAKGCVTKAKTLGQEEATLTWDASGLYLQKIAKDDQAWTYEHKPLVGLKSSTDPAGVKTVYDYDSHGRLAKVSVDGHGAVSAYEYGLVSEGSSSNFVRETSLLSADGTKRVPKASYLDGLGREWQSVLEEWGSFGAVCSVTDFDAEGRPVAKWLPAPSATKLENRSKVEAAATNHYHNGYLYTTLGYSPRQGAEPSEVWRPGPMEHEVCQPGRTRLYASATSGKYSCLVYTATLDGKLKKGSASKNGQFLVKSSTDEDGRELLEFTNHFGQKVLDRRVVSGTTYADTYYAYDPYGRLRYMLSPECSKELRNNTSKTEFTASYGSIDKLGYYYAYHPFSLAKTVRKLPGQAEILACCDSEGVPVLVQDGNQRARGVWTYTIADSHRRPALEGEAAMTKAAAEAAALSNPVAARSSSSSTGYAVQGSLQASSPDIVRYYDDYSFTSDASLAFVSGIGDAQHSSAKGRLTGIRQAGMLSATYYNRLGTPVQTRGYNQYGRVDASYTKLNFDQTPSRVETRHSRSASQSLTEVLAYSYDALGRETGVTHSANGGAARSISVSEYNAVRQLSKRTSGPSSVAYSYSVHGQVSGISSAAFTQGISYETIACASGLATSMRWKFGSGAQRTVAYAYDALGRLASAKEGSSYRSAYAYNLNGSPTSISRYGVADREGPGAVYGDIDRASFVYDGNQMKTVTDAADYLSYAGANDLPNGTSQYSYDANGNMASDSGRGISSVSYDRLNLPRRVACSDGTVVSFSYDALGRKLAETDSVPPFSLVRPLGLLDPIGGGVIIGPGRYYTVTTTEYCGSCVYRDGILQRVLIPGGYATPKTGGGFDYHYYVCDYLGSVRAVVAEDGTVEETSDYYPYGMQMPGADGEMQRKQPYKFGGKEHLSAGGLNLHDFGPRALYAPAGQFASADPKCEDYPHLSPYLYCAANPVNLIDPTGKDIFILRTGDGITDIHMAMLIQDENGKWLYYSINGNNMYVSGKFSGAKTTNSVDIGKEGKPGGEGWDSPQDFLNSDYNQDMGSNDINDEHVCNFEYSEGYLIETSSDQDEIMRNSFAEVARSDYDLFSNNCVTTVQKVMIDAGVSVSKDGFKSKSTLATFASPGIGYTSQIKVDNILYKGQYVGILQGEVFKSIINANPGMNNKRIFKSR